MVDIKKNIIYTRIYIINNKYIDNIKYSINNTTDRKELKKFNKWYIFIRYISLIFKLHRQNYHHIHNFIKTVNKIISHNNILVFCDIYIPNDIILANSIKYLDQNDSVLIYDIMYDYSKKKKLHKMIHNIYYIVHDDNTLCWQFKNDIDILLSQTNNIYSITHDTNEIHIKYDANNIISNKHSCDILNNKNNERRNLVSNKQYYTYHNNISYTYLYDMIKNSCIIYLYIIAVIIKFYTNVNILYYRLFKKLIYFIRNS